jgi:hypothetical protein
VILCTYDDGARMPKVPGAEGARWRTCGTGPAGSIIWWEECVKNYEVCVIFLKYKKNITHTHTHFEKRTTRKKIQVIYTHSSAAIFDVSLWILQQCPAPVNLRFMEKKR